MAKLTEEQRAERAAKRRLREALEAEERAVRRRELDKQWTREGTWLTWEELEAGEPCRGCGRAIIDNLGDFPARIYETPEQKADREAEDKAYLERHSGCYAVRWSMEGCRTNHCGWCCPMPPLSPAKVTEIAKLLRSFPEHPEHEYVTWRLSLTCGHYADCRAHQSNQSYNASTIDCAECGAIRGVIAAKQLPRNDVAEDSQSPSNEVEIAAVDKEIQALRKKLRAAERRRKTLVD